MSNLQEFPIGSKVWRWSGTVKKAVQYIRVDDYTFRPVNCYRSPTLNLHPNDQGTLAHEEIHAELYHLMEQIRKSDICIKKQQSRLNSEMKKREYNQNRVNEIRGTNPELFV